MLEAGAEVTVTWGKEYFQLIQFNGFDVGPISLTTRVREGETVGQAVARAAAALETAAQAEYQRKSRGHVARLRDLKALVTP